jgi:hypothetical protein
MFRGEQPVAVVVVPELTSTHPAKTADLADNGPILLLVSDVRVNGDNVTTMEEKLLIAGIHWETVRYGKTGSQ